MKIKINYKKMGREELQEFLKSKRMGHVHSDATKYSRKIKHKQNIFE